MNRYAFNVFLEKQRKNDEINERIRLKGIGSQLAGATRTLAKTAQVKGTAAIGDAAQRASAGKGFKGALGSAIGSAGKGFSRSRAAGGGLGASLRRAGSSVAGSLKDPRMQAKLKAGAKSAKSRAGQAALSVAKDIISGRAADAFNKLYGGPAKYPGRGQFSRKRLGLKGFDPEVDTDDDELGLDPLQRQQRAMYGG